MEIYLEEIRLTRVHTSTLLRGFSMIGLLTLNIERFLTLAISIFSSKLSYQKKTYNLTRNISYDRNDRSIAIVRLFSGDKIWYYA